MTAFHHSAKIQVGPHLPVTFDLYIRGVLDKGHRVGRTVLPPDQFAKLGKSTLYMSMDKAGVPDAGLEIEVHSSSVAAGVCAIPSPVSPSAPHLPVLSEGPDPFGVQACGSPGVQALRIPDYTRAGSPGVPALMESRADVWRRF